MNKDRIEFFFQALDTHLRMGENPDEALRNTVSDYAFVYFTDDGRLPIGRAAEIALKHLRETGEVQ